MSSKYSSNIKNSNNNNTSSVHSSVISTGKRPTALYRPVSCPVPGGKGGKKGR